MTSTWSTAGVQPRRQFEYWREVVCAAFVRLSPERDTPTTSFFGSIDTVALGDLSLSCVASDAQTVHRRATDIAATPAGIVYLNVQVAGTSTLTQHSRDAVLRPGQAALVDASAPFVMRFDGPFRQLSVHLDAAALANRVGELAPLCGQPLVAAPALSAVLVDVAASAWRAGRACTPEEAGALGEQVETLVAAVLSANRSAVSAHERLLRAGQRVIERRFTDPSLNALSLARELGVSPRLLQQVFHEHGRTIGSTIAGLRLRRAAAELAAGRDSVAAVAAASGFGDLSHFSRLFRARFGTSPGRYRAEQRRGDGAPAAGAGRGSRW
jgi:AraC-like DNA-binding protein